MTWTVARDLTTPSSGGDSAPSNSAFVHEADVADFIQEASRVPYVEIAIDPITATGSPTSVVLGVWRLSEGRRDKIGTITIASADFAQPPPTRLAFHGSSLSVTVDSLVGGTSPTLATKIWFRAVRQ